MRCPQATTPAAAEFERYTHAACAHAVGTSVVSARQDGFPARMNAGSSVTQPVYFLNIDKNTRSRPTFNA